jgi:peptide/nickel transport system permease protein
VTASNDVADVSSSGSASAAEVERPLRGSSIPPRKRKKKMSRWLQRLLMLPLVLFGVSIILFLASRVIPGDPVNLIVGDSAPQSVKQAIRHSLGLDQPAYVQYWRYVDGIFHGNFGDSLKFGIPVRGMITTAFPATLELVAAGALVTIVVSFTFGLLAAIYHNTWIDTLSRSAAIFTASCPPFFVGIVAILIFGYYLKWFPISGRGEPADLHHLIMPAVVLGLAHAGSTARLVRATMIDTLRADYIRSARARGIPRRTVIFKYAFRNALIPALTDLGVSLADIIGSVILIETIFAWPGIGLLVSQGIVYNDFPMLSGAILVLLVYAILVNFIVDFMYGNIDPRVRLTA